MNLFIDGKFVESIKCMFLAAFPVCFAVTTMWNGDQIEIVSDFK